ncbi:MULTISPECIES: MFS transporter [Micromonospora]|uniref:MFS transporter n=1 Tax=Micromonospora solifontis TaxID=2487138 RepID=A0ABX9WIW0_9ACTN|nr:MULTISPECIES: MFS transporter [Micromonospora]NES15640.1 MFS transporter [Micromonospora sp. PPF5-17B]NES35940.1 MFS transporter [Micromonospora solifontis]NES56987.1 MFS transporter [Micromonospora sp. PPF5-6]RNM00048.1 MFS transporter [Micromonospora solifontis]
MRTVRSWFRDTTGGLPRAFWYLWTGTLINRLGSFVLVFLAIYLTRERGFSASQAGLVIGLWGVGGAVGTTVGGTLTDRWGRRPTLLTAHLGAATMMLALGLARPLWAVALGALLLGTFAEAARPAFGAMMIDVVPEKDRLRAFSLNYWAINLGFACAAVLAGFAAQAGYLLLFVVDAATTLVTALIIFARVKETRSAVAGPTVKHAAPAGALRTILTDRVFLGFVTLNLFAALVFLQHISMLPIAMGDSGLSPATYGSVIALNGVLIVVGQLFVPRLIKGRSRSHVLALAALVMGVGFGLTAFAGAAWFYGLTVLVWTVGEMLNSPSNSTLIAELSPAALRGRYQGVFSLSWQLAGATAPILGGLVREHAGNTTLWLGCALVGGVVAVAHLVSGPARERRAAQLRTPATPARPVTVTRTPAPEAAEAAATAPAEPVRAAP